MNVIRKLKNNKYSWDRKITDKDILDIIELTKFLPEASSLKVRVHHLLHDITSIPRCSCGKNISIDEKWLRYKESCGDKSCKSKLRRRFRSLSRSEIIDMCKEKKSTYSDKVFSNQSNLQELKNLTSFLPDDSPIKERWYYVSNSLKSPVPCPNECGEKAKYHKRIVCCSKKCSQEYAIKRSEHRKVEYKKNYCWESILPDGYSFIDHVDKKIKKFHHHKCDEEFEINEHTAGRRIARGHEVCSICNPISYNKSYPEDQIFEYITGLLSENTDILRNYKSLLRNKEVDIVIPSLKLCLEFNGLYWHSEKFRDNKYHINKYNECKSLGYDVINIWSNHWQSKKEIVESIIDVRLGKNNTSIGARNCELREVSSEEAAFFFNTNHIQGFAGAGIYLGLYFKGKLVQCMSFKNHGSYWEISRLATSLNKQIIGGSKRLYTNFVRDNRPSKVISYCDLSYFLGHVYETLGMTLSHVTRPGYLYCNSSGKTLSRQQCQKHKLIRMGYDANMTEADIMKKRGYFRVFNVGNACYSQNFL